MIFSYKPPKAPADPPVWQALWGETINGIPPRMSDLQNIVADVDVEEARALHRVVRALHDGHCPSCGAIFPSEMAQFGLREECPNCGFFITRAEAEDALRQFAPLMRRSLEIFEKWRKKRNAS